MYVVGFYLTFCWAAYRAPELWADVGFRERWKFMLVRWRPDTYYWGTMVMTRNLTVAFAGVISSEPRVQLCYVVAIVLLVLSITAVYQPWRATTLNHYDVLSCIILCFIGILGLIFVSVEEEIGYLSRLGATNAVIRKTSMRDGFATALSVMIGAFMALFVLLLGWTCALMFPAQQEKQSQANAALCKDVLEMLVKCVKTATFEEEAKRLINESTAYDRGGLVNFISKIGVDPTSQKSGTTDTISIKRISQDRGQPQQPASVSA